LIEAALPRRTQFSRSAAGSALAQQVIAANVVLAVVVCGLDRDFNLRRLERLFGFGPGERAEPVVVLNKADLCEAPQEQVEAVVRLAPGARVTLLSAHQTVDL
jgi:ribosome biogenesis GTPase